MRPCAKLIAMLTGFRSGFYGGLSIALLLGLFLLWLWQPERQLKLHTANLFHSMEHKNWQRMADFIGTDYQDQWGHDRARVLERAREVFRYLRNIQIGSSRATVQIDKRRAQWIGKITIDADQSEVAALIKERVNSLDTSFELEWHCMSGKPWDWKLVRVSNPSLEIPAGAY
jgi:hypothetical protein